MDSKRKVRYAIMTKRRGKKKWNQVLFYCLIHNGMMSPKMVELCADINRCKIKTGKRSKKTELTGKSPLRR